MLIFKLLTAISLGAFSAASERYQPEDEPPETGWKSAIKYFQKDGKSVARSPQSSGSDATYDQLIFLDNTIFVNNRMGSEKDHEGQWGLSLGYEWDKSWWWGKGLYIRHDDYDLERKYSVLGGLFFPSIESRFPLYLKANVGLGYFIGEFSSSTLTVDYNLYTGLRIFAGHGMLFNLELGSKNYSRLLTSSYLNSFVISSGLAFAF